MKMIKSEKGQSLLEFALIVPLLLLLVSGIFDFGRFLYSYAHLHMGAQEAVRLAGLGKTDAEVTAFANDYIHIGDNSNLKVFISPKPPYRKSGDYVTVRLEYSFSMITPIISKLFSEQLLVADSTIRIE